MVAITFSFVGACGDDEGDDDSGGGGSATGGKGGTATGGKGGTATGGQGGSVTGGTAGSGGRGGSAGKGGTGGTAGLGGEGGVGEGGEGGEEAGGAGGMGGDTPTCDPVTLPSVFIGELSGTQEVPMNASTGTGATIAELNALETQLTVSVYYSGLSSNTVAGHVHGPAAPGANAPVLFNLNPATGTMAGQVVAATFPITPTQVAQLKGGQMYTNIHSMNFMNGEIRAQLLPAAVIRSGTLSADEEVPTNSSPGTGRAMAVLFPSATRAVVSVTYSGLTGPAAAGHVHGPAAPGVNAGILIDLHPAAAVSGAVTHALWPLTMTQAADLLAGMNYANIHTAGNPNGEIRAQLLPACP